jgi:Mrp family chromosome partitioning ATPase
VSSHIATSRLLARSRSAASSQRAAATGAAVRTAEQMVSSAPPALIQGCREALQRMAADGTVEHIAVTSSIRGEGRSTVAAGLAIVSALDHELRTVLVDLDLDSPSQARRLGLAEGSGINDLTESPAHIEDYLQPVVSSLWLMSAGRPRSDAPRALNRFASSGLLSQLREWADMVVFDLPPLFGSSTGTMAARVAPQPVLVVRAGTTQVSQVARAVELFPEPPAVIVNGIRSSLPRWLQRVVGDWR